MRVTSYVCIGLLSGCLSAACGAESRDPDPSTAGQSSGGAGATGTSGVAGTAGTASTAGNSRVPEKHRPTAIACDHERVPNNPRAYADVPPPVACTRDEECVAAPNSCAGSCRTGCVESETGAGKRCSTVSGECLRDADCSGGDNGRCINNREHYSCSYDSCYADATCTSGGPCVCEPDGVVYLSGNQCLPGNCQTDAGCGEGGFCSPTFGSCGNYSGVIGYYCHTPDDACVDDADCIDSERAGYCMYSPEIGHWTCGYGQCVG